ncbi:hypothetical protein ANCDUO_04905 [Ancylostoma duodenale]|uniref:Uncharacterized protein n=1 Tax=Ancylostoma duodenale TaxID=51022 RepID=A0A0C2H5S4_9BILA|nr:hypothetical protein ANCDUO_04905 [Ancylostoma duodenale]
MTKAIRRAGDNKSPSGAHGVENTMSHFRCIHDAGHQVRVEGDEPGAAEGRPAPVAAQLRAAGRRDQVLHQQDQHGYVPARPAPRARVSLALAADFANCALSLSVVDRSIVTRRSIRSMRCAGMVCLGEYSCLRTQMVLRREFSYYLLQVCPGPGPVPPVVLVIVSSLLSLFLYLTVCVRPLT